jgi:hypothetical protein
MPKRLILMLALRVSDSADDGPDVAVVTVTPERLRQWIAEIDQVRLLKQAGTDTRMYGVLYWDAHPYWLKGGELAQELAEVVDEEEWQRLTVEQADQVDAADREHDARAEAPRRFVDADGVQWRAYPKWGSGQWETAELSRDTLVQLYRELLGGHVALPDMAAVALPEGELRVFQPEPEAGDLGPMYVLDVLGVSLLIRQRADGMYVHIDGDAISDPPTGSVEGGTTTLLVDVNNGGEQEHSL